MIISASRRTDIPAWYAEWLENRIAAGYCTVANPFNPSQVSYVSLAPDDVDAIVFWTRDAAPLFPLLPTLRDRYRFYFHYTITGYGPPVEPFAPCVDEATDTFRRLATALRPGAVVWRFDPLILGPAFPPEAHFARFEAIARALEGHARRVIVSPVNLYRKTERRLGELYRWEADVVRAPYGDPSLPALMMGLARLAKGYGMDVFACAPQRDFSPFGVEKARCIDDRLLRELFGGEWSSAKDPGQRPDCACVTSKDIGMVDTCLAGCVYCYATWSHAQAVRRHAEHDPRSPSLHGHHEAPPPEKPAQLSLPLRKG